MNNLKDLFCNIKWLIRQSFGKRLGHYYMSPLEKVGSI